MTVYLTYQGFCGLSTMPQRFVDDVETRSPGFTDKQIAYWSRWLDTRLRKRYATPFHAHDDVPDPTPLSVQGWIVRIVTLRVWLRRGVDSNDEQFAIIKEDEETARAEILEAANGEESWFDLPARDDKDGSLIARGGPRSYSEQSPYVYTDSQARTAHSEDSNGSGSFNG